MAELVDVKGINKAELLAALYNASHAQGMGIYEATSAPMTKEEASKLLSNTPRMYFDYLKGRIMKISVLDDQVDPWGYDRDNGSGSVARIVAKLRNR